MFALNSHDWNSLEKNRQKHFFQYFPHIDHMTEKLIKLVPRTRGGGSGGAEGGRVTDSDNNWKVD